MGAECRDTTRLRKGSSASFSIEKKLGRLYTYGALSEMRIENIGECVDNGYLESAGGLRPVMVLTEKGKQFMKR